MGVVREFGCTLDEDELRLGDGRTGQFRMAHVASVIARMNGPERIDTQETRVRIDLNGFDGQLLLR